MNLSINHTRLVPAAALSICLIVVALLSIPRGLANFLHYPVEKNIEHWLQFNGRTVNDRHNKAMISRLQKALQKDPANPDILVIIAVLLDQSTLDRYFWERDTTTHRGALEIFKKAARSRPVSPWVWINIALIKTKLKEYDSEMENSLIQAIRLGPREPLVNVRVTDIGLARWASLSTRAREAVKGGIRRGFDQSRADIIRIAKNHRRTGLLCRLLGNKIAAEPLCKDG